MPDQDLRNVVDLASQRAERAERTAERAAELARVNGDVIGAVTHAQRAILDELAQARVRAEALASNVATLRANFRDEIGALRLAVGRLETAAGTNPRDSRSDEAVAALAMAEAERKRDSVRARADKRGVWLAFVKGAMLPIAIALGLLAASRIRACSPVVDSIVAPSEK